MAPIELSVIRDLVAIFSFIIGLSYYIMNLRNQERARQMQIILQTYQKNTNEDVINRWIEIMYREWETVDEYFTKYTSWTSFWAFSNGLESIGILLKRGLIDRSLVYEFYPTNVIVFWNKYEPIVVRARERWGNTHYMETVEWLAGELDKERISQGRKKPTEYQSFTTPETE